MIKSDSLGPDGSLYKMLHNTIDRVITASILTCIMLVVSTALSFVLPIAAVLAILFAPGVLTFAFGGILPRKHYAYNLGHNQILAIEAYNSADEYTKKYFPRDFVQTVRSTSNFNDQLALAKEAQKLVDAQRKRIESMNLRDDKVEVTLQILREQTESLEREIDSNKEVYGPKPTPDDLPRVPRRMVGRKIVQDR